MARKFALIWLVVLAVSWTQSASAASPWDGEWEGEIKQSRLTCSPCKMRLTVQDGVPNISGDVSVLNFKIDDAGQINAFIQLSIGYTADCSLRGRISGDTLTASGRCVGSGIEDPQLTLRRVTSSAGLPSPPPPSTRVPSTPSTGATQAPTATHGTPATTRQKTFGAGTQPLRLVDLTYDMPTGDRIGELQFGSWLTSCGAGRTVPLTRKTFEQPTMDGFQAVFGILAKSRGFSLGGRVETSELTAASYLVAARVTAMNWVSCMRENSKPPQWSGSGTMTIAWQVLRAGDGQPVYSTTTQTSSSQPSAERRTDGLSYLFVTTFGDAVLQLISTPAFRDAVRRPPGAAQRPHVDGTALIHSPPLFRSGITGNMKAILPAVVEIRSDIGTGSGFVIDASGLILTNAHVVRGDDTVTVAFADGGKVDGTVLKRDLGRDVALIRVVRAGLKALPIRRAEPVLTEKVYAIGSPLGLSQTVTEGIVSSYRHQQNGLDLIQATPAISPGNSGGPLLDGSGNVIGISMLFSKDLQNLNFFIPIESALGFLDLRLAGR
jgi:S1-C subfamily serine protease